MQRISTEVDGTFKNGVPGVQRGTQLNAEWFNAVQEEIAGFIESAGLTLDDTNNGQLLQALTAIFLSAAGVSFTKVSAIGSGGNAELVNTGLSVNTDGGSSSVSHDGFSITIGQKTVKISAEVIQNAIVMTVNEIFKFAKNVVLEAGLNVGGNAQFDGNVNVDGALNVAGAIAAAGGFVGGASGGAGTQANYPLMRTDVLRARTSGGKVSVPDGATGNFEGNFSGKLIGSWNPGSAFASRNAEVLYPLVEMAGADDGEVWVFYNHYSGGPSFVLSWRDMNYDSRSLTIVSGTPVVFMKKKNSLNQDCGLVLSVGPGGVVS